MISSIIFLILSSVSCESYTILGIFPLSVKSHFIMYESLLKGLVKKGHDVDVVSHFPQKTPISGYNDYSILGSSPYYVNHLPVSHVENLNLAGVMSFMMYQGGIETCEHFLNTPTATILKNTTKKYDLLITEIFGSDCCIGFAHYFKIPVISMSSTTSLPWADERVGNPDNPSYIPNFFSKYVGKMSVIERIINTVHLLEAKLRYHIISMPKSNALARNFFGPDLPDLRDLVYNTSLILINSHFSINQARPLVPNFIEVAGLHIDEPKPLPEHLADFIENSQGVIYLSMGSMVLTETFNKEKLKGILDAFAELPYKVLWKASRENFPRDIKLPDNIRFEKWLPQLDILCHPKVKLFVTHGGLMGTQEAIRCAIPRLGIPIFADQEVNILRSVAMGLALKVSYADISKKTILDATSELLNNPMYKMNAVKISMLFWDRPMSPLETAIYWVDYVIKYHGAPHLQNIGTYLPWYQYYLVDVLSIIAICFSFTFLLIYIMLKKFIRLVSSLSSIKIKND